MQAEHPPPSNSKYISLFIQSKEFNLLTAGCLPCIAQLWNVASVLVTEDRQKQMTKLKCRQTSEMLWVPDSAIKQTAQQQVTLKFFGFPSAYVLRLRYTAVD